MNLERIASELEIRDVLARYCRGIDRLDADLVRACYHPDAVDHHPGFEGGVEEFLEWSFRVLQRFAATMHLLGNVLVELTDDGQTAAVETYAVAHHRGVRPDPAHNLEAGIRYVDRFERRPADSSPPAWRIAERFVVVEWQRTIPPEQWWPVAEGSALTGARDRTDLVYRMRDGMG